MVVLFLILGGTSILFSREAAPVYKHTRSIWGVTCLHSLANTIYVIFKIIAILHCVRWYHILVLICITLMISDVEQLFLLTVGVTNLLRNFCNDKEPLLRQRQTQRQCYVQYWRLQTLRIPFTGVFSSTSLVL